MPNTRIERRSFLAGVGGMAATIATRPLEAEQAPPLHVPASAPRFMYVGSFTAKDSGHGDGLSFYRRGGESNPWTLVEVIKDFADPSFLIVNRQGTCLYAAHGDGTQATAFRIDAASGKLTVINRQPTGGTNGVHLAIDATGRWLVLANYATGSVVVLPIGLDGALGARTALSTLTGTPGPHRTQQESSHPHHCPFDPTGRVVVVPDKGLDRVFAFRVDADRGTLVPATPPSVATRSAAAPRHAAFHPRRPFVYVINELDSTIASYRFDATTGALEPRQVITTLPTTHTGNNSGAEIVVSPSGRFVYGSNRGHDSIAIFAVDEATSLLTPVGWEPTRGRTPRFFCLDPSGTHLYAANQGSDTVVIFRVDAASGKLTATGETIAVKTPTTIAFR